MKHQLSHNEISILRTICANGGEYRSLFRLAVELEMDYKRCWKCVVSLAFQGLIDGERSTAAGSGRGYILRIPCGVRGGPCLCNPLTLLEATPAGSLSRGVALHAKTGTRKAERALGVH